jgi:hypothetical protein
MSSNFYFSQKGPEELHEYCKRLFEFDTVRVKKFKTWNDRKTFIRKAKLKNPVKFVSSIFFVVECALPEFERKIQEETY